MKQKSYTALYAVLQALVWGSFGVIIAFAAPYFKAYGLSDAQYGVLLAAVSAISFFAQLGLGELCSRVRCLTLQRVLAILGILMLLCCLALVFLPLTIVWIASLYCLTAISIQVLPSLVNALGMAGLDTGLKINVGVARAFGSVGYAALSFVTGQLMDFSGKVAVPALHLILGLSLTVAALCFPRVLLAEQKSEASGKPLWRDFRFLTVLVGTTLLYVSHNFLCNFIYQITVARGGGEAEQGVCLAIAAFCELPCLFLFSKLLKHRQSDFWLKLSGVFMTLRVLCCLLAPNIGWLYAVQFFQLGGFALFAVASFFYVGAIVDKKDTVRAQAMLASTCTLSNLITFLFGGAVIDRLGASFILLCATVCAALGTAILALFAKKPCQSGNETSEVSYDETVQNKK